MSLKKLRPSVPAEMPADYRKLMERCWAFALGERPTFQVPGCRAPHRLEALAFLAHGRCMCSHAGCSAPEQCAGFPRPRACWAPSKHHALGEPAAPALQEELRFAARVCMDVHGGQTLPQAPCTRKHVDCSCNELCPPRPRCAGGACGACVNSRAAPRANSSVEKPYLSRLAAAQEVLACLRETYTRQRVQTLKL